MGLIVNNLDWETTFRKQVRKLREGWNVRKSSKTNKVSLVVREKHKPSQETVLPFKWTEDDTGNAYARIRNIYALMLDGELTLKQALKNLVCLVEDRRISRITFDYYMEDYS